MRVHENYLGRGGEERAELSRWRMIRRKVKIESKRKDDRTIKWKEGRKGV